MSFELDEIEEYEEESQGSEDLDCDNCPVKDICERPCGMGDDFEPLHD